MNFLAYLWLAIRVYRKVGANGSYYAAVTHHGVPQTAIFIGTGRNAWRISQRAMQEYRLVERRWTFGTE